MAGNVTVEVKGLSKLAALLDKYPAISEKHVNTAINRSLVRVLGAEKKEAPVGTGNLRDNWRVDMSRFAGTLSSNAPYSMAVHFGSRPHMPPATDSFFQLWCRKKGLNPWAVARSIARKGTRPNPFFQRAVDSQQAQINGEFSNALDNIVKEIADGV